MDRSRINSALDSTVDLLARANGGDQSAWDLLVKLHFEPLKQVVERRLSA